MASSVAIIGAGMAGLAAARALTAAGIPIVIYEKSRALGGRVATRRIGGCLVDHGAQNVKPGESALADVMLRELPTEDLICIEAPVRLYTSDGQIWPPDPQYESEPKYAYRRGLTTLPKLLAQSLPIDLAAIRFESRIHRLEETAEEVVLRGEGGVEIGRAALVIVTAPAPQAADLLGDSAMQLRDLRETLDRVRTLRNVEYPSCLSVLLGYAAPHPDPPAYALLSEDRSAALLWLAFEHLKAPERAPGGEALLIAQLGPLFSRLCAAEPDELIVGRTLNELRPLFGDLYDRPLWAQVKRWRYSQPRGTVGFVEVNPPDSPSSILVCGDALQPGNGRIQQAYASGLEAAEAALQRLS
jgi:predicted NAD/FAD-dependent oxidoreductase